MGGWEMELLAGGLRFYNRRGRLKRKGHPGPRDEVQSGLQLGQRRPVQDGLPGSILWPLSDPTRKASLTELEAPQMPSICVLDPEGGQETCDHRDGVFLAVGVGPVQGAQHRAALGQAAWTTSSAAQAGHGVPGMTLFVPHSHAKKSQSQREGLP